MTDTQQSLLSFVALDLQTAFALGALQTWLLGLVVLAATRDFPASLRHASRAWWLGTLAQGTAYILLAQQSRLPAGLSMVFANALLTFGYALYSVAASRTERLPDARQIQLALALAVVCAAIIAWFTYVTPSVASRFVAASVINCSAFGSGIRVLLLRQRAYPSPSRILLLIAFVAAGGFFLLRGFYYLLMPSDRGSLLQSGFAGSLDAIFAALLPVLMTAAFLSLCADSLRVSIEKLAATDPLTGLLNRRSLAAAGERALDVIKGRSHILALLLVDIDHFKAINDTHGHAVGDEALRRVAQRLAVGARTADTVGRLGGEEFLVICFIQSTDQAARVAERYRLAIEQLDVSDILPRSLLTVSIGVAICEGDASSFDDLLQHADAALYVAKRSGRNRVAVHGPLSTHDCAPPGASGTGAADAPDTARSPTP